MSATIPKLSKVKSVQGTGTFNSNYGLLYKFEYEMEDGTIIAANHKSETAFMPIGAHVEYQIKTTNTYGNSGTVSKPKEIQQAAPNTPSSSFVKSPDVQDMIIRQSSVKSAIEYMIGCGKTMNMHDMLNRAESIFKYCKDGSIEPQQSTKSPF